MTSVNEAYQYAAVRDGLIYLKPYLDFPERKIGEVKESEESSLKYFIDRFDIAKKKVEALIQAIEEAQNKGSYLMKLIHIREYLAKFDAIGNYIELFERLDDEEKKLREIITENKVKNLEIKKGLILEAEQLISSPDWKLNSDKFKELRAKWIKTGGVDKEFHDEVENKFQDLVETFFNKRKTFYEEKNQMIIDRVLRYEDLLKKAETVVRAGKTPENVRKLKEIQFEWKKTGKIPQQKLLQLSGSFKRHLNQFFDASKKRTFPPRPADPGVKPWEDLCVLAEDEVNGFTNDSVRKIKNIQAQWQVLGPIKKKGHFDLVERFKAAVTGVYELDNLHKTAIRRFGLFFKKTEAEQIKLKVGLLTEFINKGVADLKTFEENFSKVSAAEAADKDFNKMLQSKLNAQKRKIEVMKKIQIQLNLKLASLQG